TLFRSAPEAQTDFGEAGTGQLAREGHGDHARTRDALVAARTLEVGNSHAMVRGDDLLDALDRQRGLARLSGGVAQDLAYERFGDGEALELRERGDADESTFELAHVRTHQGGEVDRDVLRNRDVLVLRLLAQDRDAGLEVGRLHVGDEAPVEARRDA